MKPCYILSRSEMKKVMGGDENYIRQFRDEKCLSQEYMASQLGISQSTYQKIETGKVNLSEERLNEIARILKREVDELKFGYSHKINTNDIKILKQIIATQEKEIERLKNLLSELQTKVS